MHPLIACNTSVAPQFSGEPERPVRKASKPNSRAAKETWRPRAADRSSARTGRYFLFDVFHPGVRVALFVIE